MPGPRPARAVENESGQRPGNPDVEQDSLRVDRRADADESAQRSREGRGSRQKVGQRGIHAVVNAGQIVAQLMSHQNGQERQRERQAGPEKGGAAQADGENFKQPISVEKRQVAREVVLHVRTHQSGGEDGREQHETVQPQALFGRLGRNGGGRLPPGGLRGRAGALDQVFGKHLVQGLKFFTRLESYRFTRRNGYFGAGARVAADARLARLHREYAKATELDAVALFQSALHLLEHCFDRHFGFGLGDTGAIHDFVDDVEFDQSASELTN